ncbi:MAG: VOC family protein [Armatimonadetes bacterium]|nr:MAG: VOC family protein [Armatimonadota bacterium]
MPYINYVEFNVGDVDASRDFYKKVFDWDPQPWGADDYLLAAHGDEPGIDTGITPSPDGEPFTVATITVDDIAGYMAKVLVAGGEIVVPRFEIPDIGEACYFTDPTGMVVGLFQPEVGRQTSEVR